MRRPALSVGLILALVAPSTLAAPPDGRLPDAPSFDRQVLFRDVLRKSDFRPSQMAIDHAAKLGQTIDPDAPFVRNAPMQAAALPIKVVGEIAVMEGDEEIVTDYGNGDYGLRYDNAR